MILMNCGDLTFSRKYCHTEAHQDDKMMWEELSGEVQLNTACNADAKTLIRRQDITDLPQQEAFPLGPICMFMEGKKMMSDTGPHIRYAAGQHIARSFYHETLWMFINAFDEVDWLNVYHTLNKEAPRLFQVWACKRVMNISANNKNLHWHYQDGCSDKCPCCTVHVEIAEDVILCLAVGRVEAFMQSSQALEHWMEEANTDPDLIDCIVEYVQSWGTLTMTLAVQNASPQFQALGQTQDTIGWWHFLEGMISKEMVALQHSSMPSTVLR
jgi:hypothetical protein